MAALGAAAVWLYGIAAPYAGYAALGAVAYGAAGGFSSAKKPKYPPPQKFKPPTMVRGKKGVKKVQSETTRAQSYVDARRRRGSSRASSQIVMPGYLSPAQTERPGLSDVLG